ncbi:MAG: hypothetical protein ABSE50_03150 [Xanthobacteraceae bacterium]
MQQAHARKRPFHTGFGNIDRAVVSALIPFPLFVSLARHKSSHADTLGKRTNVALRRLLTQSIGIDGT